MLDRGYGFGVAGVVAIILTGPVHRHRRRDLLATNLVIVIALGAVMFAVSLDALRRDRHRGVRAAGGGVELAARAG